MAYSVPLFMAVGPPATEEMSTMRAEPAAFSSGYAFCTHWHTYGYALAAWTDSTSQESRFTLSSQSGSGTLIVTSPAAWTNSTYQNSRPA